MRRKRYHGPRLTIKAAKAIAEQEIGKATGIKPYESNSAIFQRYEIPLGNFTAAITTAYGYPGIAYFSLAGVCTYYDIKTLRENFEITEKERRNSQREGIRDLASSDSYYMLKALKDELGLESCHRILNEM